MEIQSIITTCMTAVDLPLAAPGYDSWVLGRPRRPRYTLEREVRAKREQPEGLQDLGGRSPPPSSRSLVFPVIGQLGNHPRPQDSTGLDWPSSSLWTVGLLTVGLCSYLVRIPLPVVCQIRPLQPSLFDVDPNLHDIESREEPVTISRLEELVGRKENRDATKTRRGNSHTSFCYLYGGEEHGVEGNHVA
ncbi:hypothetical protein LZ30DRAFT_227753 [Colletotrichum cereale]|nr:hypothetical protein LZ30DRAFT_227753 [Colletotrichum cereale]